MSAARLGSSRRRAEGVVSATTVRLLPMLATLIVGVAAASVSGVGRAGDAAAARTEAWPVPIPDWFWVWAPWHLGRAEFADGRSYLGTLFHPSISRTDTPSTEPRASPLTRRAMAVSASPVGWPVMSSVVCASVLG